MISRRRLITLAIVVTGVCLGGSAVWLKWRDRQSFFDIHVLLSRFPVEDAAVLNIDFSLLRRGGYLRPSKVPLESEYKQFLDGTGFDYRRDLDLVVASFSKSGNFFIARGRFNWSKLRDYTARQGGSCYQDLCRLQGTTPERHISFLPLREDTIGLAVSTDDLAASRLTKAGEAIKADLPAAPVWLSIPGTALREQGAVPPGIRVVLSALVNADRVVVTMNPAANAVELRLEATCRTEDEAGVLASQLRSTIATIREAMAHDKQAAQDEFARTLARGNFVQTERRVTGRWPIEQRTLDSLTAGI